MSKKVSTKRQKSQAKRQRMRRKPVSYIAVPKPLWKRLNRLLPKRAKGQVGRPALSNRLVLDARLEGNRVCVVDGLSMEGDHS